MRFISILIFLAFALSGCFPKQCEMYIRQHTPYDNFAGIIKECYFLDSDGGRGTPTIVLQNEKIYYLVTYTLICFAQPGDSIIKKAGTLKYIIKREDCSTIFYPECGSTVILDNGKVKENPLYAQEVKCDKRK